MKQAAPWADDSGAVHAKWRGMRRVIRWVHGFTRRRNMDGMPTTMRMMVALAVIVAIAYELARQIAKRRREAGEARA